MRSRDFHFELPEALIAQYPPEQRGDSRLLCLDRDSGSLNDQLFSQLGEHLNSGDLLVFNDTRVIPARLFGRKESGGKVEILLERLLDEHTMLCQIRASKSPKAGSLIILEDESELCLIGREAEFFKLSSKVDMPLADILQKLGHMPLPPYIKREDESMDQERYQTVYARQPGAVAAPTAGLHFSDEMLTRLKQKGVDTAFVTLHVGAGTFQPVRSEKLEDHEMHSEWFSLNNTVCEKVRETRRKGGRVIAVGTTAVRCLESAAENDDLQPFQGDTSIFIYPGFHFQIVDALITNFHLPESTLLMLVSAFAGIENVKAAYQHAVDESYRFFSYGDAMFISSQQS
ncbi:MAG: tRNA preQ1(34) S-adenosylmethionine ribosyltransferase-isomerase QueA [Gammaproteobacteria bacterium]|jgi:S-adenosylmethionine:tRNA ribosyltransferase-isomerase|nr:tRNA preQ1(34) S-adenosylmethionine ribosyltransferase-isomerase QueA [Gammaproteobacteria bacterium]